MLNAAASATFAPHRPPDGVRSPGGDIVRGSKNRASPNTEKGPPRITSVHADRKERIASDGHGSARRRGAVVEHPSLYAGGEADRERVFPAEDAITQAEAELVPLGVDLGVGIDVLRMKPERARVAAGHPKSLPRREGRPHERERVKLGARSQAKHAVGGVGLVGRARLHVTEYAISPFGRYRQAERGWKRFGLGWGRPGVRRRAPRSCRRPSAGYAGLCAGALAAEAYARRKQQQRRRRQRQPRQQQRQRRRQAAAGGRRRRELGRRRGASRGGGRAEGGTGAGRGWRRGEPAVAGAAAEGGTGAGAAAEGRAAVAGGAVCAKAICPDRNAPRTSTAPAMVGRIRRRPLRTWS